MLIELDDAVYARLLAFCEGRNINDELDALVLWAIDNLPATPFVTATPKQYYDREKYLATSRADALRRDISPEDPEYS